MNSMSKRDSTLRIIVAGYLVRGPLGGSAWQYLQYVLALQRLGHDVHFVEDSGDERWCCYDPSRDVVDENPTFGLSFTREAFDRVGFGEKWAYFDAHTDRWLGPSGGNMTRVCSSADLLINLSGGNPIRSWLAEIPIRVFVDTDPVFTQVKHLKDSARLERAEAHNFFFSFGENIGLDSCSVPDDGFDWSPTRQPVVLDTWPVTPGPPAGAFSTVLQWDSYSEQEYAGVHYGMKSKSFDAYIDIPGKVDERFELSVGSATAPRARLREKGWHLSNPLETARDPFAYQEFIQASKGEFSVAKHGYVVSHSGWFSERSASYLASGRPVIVEDSGFSEWLPVGTGVLPFSSPDEAVAQVEEAAAHYDRHCATAREITETYFDSQRVLGELIDHCTD